MNIADIKELYNGTGWNVQDLMKLLDEKHQHNYEHTSYDGSLKVYGYDGFIAVASSGSGLDFITEL